MPQQKQFKVLLIGDSCTDEYVYGTCERLNPEAPVPILKYNRKITMLTEIEITEIIMRKISSYEKPFIVILNTSF